MQWTSGTSEEGHKRKVHLVPSKNIFYLSLEHSITSLDGHLPQQLSHLLLPFAFLSMFCLKISESSLVVHACFQDDAEDTSKTSTTLGCGGPVSFTEFDSGTRYGAGTGH